MLRDARLAVIDSVWGHAGTYTRLRRFGVGKR